MNIEEILLDIQKQTSETNVVLQLMKKDFDVVAETVDKHEKLLMGNPQNMGDGGIIATIKEQARSIDGLGRRIDSIRSLFAPLWTGIVAIVSALVSGLFQYFARKGN